MSSPKCRICLVHNKNVLVVGGNWTRILFYFRPMQVLSSSSSRHYLLQPFFCFVFCLSLFFKNKNFLSDSVQRVEVCASYVQRNTSRPRWSVSFSFFFYSCTKIWLCGSARKWKWIRDSENNLHTEETMSPLNKSGTWCCLIFEDKIRM